MAGTASMWTRFKNSILGRSGEPETTSKPAVSEILRPAGGTAQIGVGPSTGAAPRPTPSAPVREAAPTRSPLVPTTKQPSLAQMQDTYNKVLHMMEKVEQYFENNEARAEHMAKSVERFTDSLDRLAESQTKQGDSIRAIAEVAERNGNLTAQAGEALAEMPASLQQLSETLNAVIERVTSNQEALLDRLTNNQQSLVDQVEIVKRTHGSFAEALDKFSQAVDELGSASRANADTFKRIGVTEMEQRHNLTQMVSKHMRRFTVLVGVFGGLGLAALVGIISLMLMLLDRPG